MAYSMKRRLEVPADAEQGMGRKEIALTYNCSESWARRLNLEVRKAIESAQAEMLFLRPFSPDLNPIENAFSKFKWLLKSA